MRKINTLYILAVLLYSFLVSPAGYAGNWYLSASGGDVYMPHAKQESAISHTTMEFDNGYGFTAALGYAFKNNFRLEGEAGYTINDFNHIDVAGVARVAATGWIKQWTGMLNGYYDFKNTSRFTPYLGGGAGVSRNSMELNAAAFGGALVYDTDYSFTYQLSGGVSYDIAPKTNLFLSYRYMNTPKLQVTSLTGVDSTAKIATHSGLVGLRYNF